MTFGVTPKSERLVTALEDNVIHRIPFDLQPLEIPQDVLAASQERRCALILDAHVRILGDPATSSHQCFALCVGLFNLKELIRSPDEEDCW